MDSRPRKILFIGSDNDSLFLYKRILVIRGKLEGCHFIDAGDGTEGFQKALEYKPDLMIVEKWSPDIDYILNEYEWWLKEGLESKPAFDLEPYLSKIKKWYREVKNPNDYHFQYEWWLSVKIQKALNPHILAIILLNARTILSDADPPYSAEFIQWVNSPLHQMLMKPIEVDQFANTAINLLEAVEKRRGRRRV